MVIFAVRTSSAKCGLLQHALLHVRYDLSTTTKHREKTSTNITLAHLRSCKRTVHNVLYYRTKTSKRQKYSIHDLQWCIWCIGSYIYVRRYTELCGYVVYFISPRYPSNGLVCGGASLLLQTTYVFIIWLLWIDILFKWQPWDDWARSMHIHHTIMSWYKAIG